jgi:glycosyltransferase involved in cell wall biosynthesis
MKPCLLVPVYNHGDTLPRVLRSVADTMLPCLVVDDGSDDSTRATVDGLPAVFPWVSIERFPTNRGRGAALRHGYVTAARRGFSHAVQLDADGQHCAADVPRLLEQARRQPGALILGRPLFDASAPPARRYGRELSRLWVHIETLSVSIGDPLCGFRCVPLDRVVQLLARFPCGNRMEFDPELAVRWVWEGWPVVNVPTRVIYPPGGRSHFRLLEDNARISLAHARLVLGMLVRLPGLLRRKRLG